MTERRTLTPEDIASFFDPRPSVRREALAPEPSPQDIYDRQFWEELARILDELEKDWRKRWKVQRVRGAFRWLFNELEGR